MYDFFSEEIELCIGLTGFTCFAVSEVDLDSVADFFSVGFWGFKRVDPCVVDTHETLRIHWP